MDQNQEHQDPQAMEGGDAPTQPQEPTPQMVPDEPGTEQQPDASKNVLIVIVLAVIVVVLALMFMWGSRVEEQPVPQPPVMEEPAPPEVPAEVPVSASDEVQVLEEELDATEVESLDAELNELEAALDEELQTL